MKRLSAAVIGLGRIGVGFDDPREPHRVLTHAKALHLHPSFSLVGGVDPSTAARHNFEKHYCAPAFPSFRGLLREVRPPEVVTIGVPTAVHLGAVREVLSLHVPRAVLLEKPVAQDLSHAKHIARIFSATPACEVVVNFIRRFEPGYLRLRKEIQSGRLGRFRKGVCWYTKGLVNNGSHYVNLLSDLLGAPGAPRVFRKGRAFPPGDVEPDFFLRFGPEGEVHFLAGREEEYSNLQLELHFEGARVCYSDGGASIKVTPAAPDPVFRGYRVLREAGSTTIATDLGRYMWHSVDHVARRLSGKTGARSDMAGAMETMCIVSAVTRKARRMPQ